MARWAWTAMVAIACAAPGPGQAPPAGGGGDPEEEGVDSEPTDEVVPPEDTDGGGALPEIGVGVAGGWSIEHAGEVAGARFIHPVNTDKDGSMVASRVASALAAFGVPATSDARAAAVAPTRMSDASYVDEATRFVVDDLYGALAGAGRPDQPLLSRRTLVLTSVHRYGLYVAEAMHARVLPLQIISFAEDWAQVEAAAERALIIVGQDTDYDGLWLWNKLAAGEPGTGAAELPTAYAQAVAEAEELVIVQPDDNWSYCTPASCADTVHEIYTGIDQPIYLHSSVTRSAARNLGTRLYADAVAAGQVVAAPRARVANLKQWEWGVPDTAVARVEALWAELGKDPARLHIIRSGVVDLFAATPELWRRYLEANGRAPGGVHVSSYWMAATQLERCGASLPMPAYAWYQPDWSPLDDAARALLDTLCPGGRCEDAFAAGSRAFVNHIGSAWDREAVADLFTDYGLTAERGAAFGFGIHALGAAPWTGWDGEPTWSGWERVARAIQDPVACPTQAWAPLSADAVCSVPGAQCDP